MDEQRVRALTQEIWDAVPRDLAAVWLWKDPDRGLMLEGNREGLMRFASELLWASTGQISDPAYLFRMNSDVIASVCLRTGPLPAKRKPAADWKQALLKVGCVLVVLFVAACVVVGFITIIRTL